VIASSADDSDSHIDLSMVLGGEENLSPTMYRIDV
jgi:hypothetical protein